MTIHFLQLDKGGSLSHEMRDVPSDGARWDASPAPTVTLYTRTGETIRALTTVSLGPTTTLASDVAADAKAIGIGTTSSLRRWEEYVIGPNASGEWERVRLDSIGPTWVKALDPLVYAYSSGNTFKSHRMSTVVSTTHTATVEFYCYADWAYTVDGLARRTATDFCVSRYAPRLNITALDAVQFDPAARDQIGSNQKIDLVLRDLWERHVLPDVAKRLGSPGAMVSSERVDAAMLYRFAEHLYRQGRNTERADKYAELYTNQLEEIALGVVDLDEDGGQSADEVPASPRVCVMLRG